MAPKWRSHSSIEPSQSSMELSTFLMVWKRQSTSGCIRWHGLNALCTSSPCLLCCVTSCYNYNQTNQWTYSPQTNKQINGARFRHLGQPEAGISMHMHITPGWIKQSWTACLPTRHAHNDSIPVESPRGSLLMCVTMYCLSSLVSLSLHDLWSIVKLWLINTMSILPTFLQMWNMLAW